MTSKTTQNTVQADDSTKPVQEKSEPSMNQKKMKQEWIWKTLFILVTVGSSVLFHKIYQYQTLDNFASIRKGTIFDLLIVGIPFAVIFVGLDFATHYFLDSACEKYYISWQKYPDQQTRKKRCYTNVKWAFSIVYYALTSIAAYTMLLDTSYLPTWLGGSGQCTNVLQYVTNSDELTEGMKIYYGLQFGKHLGRFFQHVFIRPEGNFYEYTLHHGLSMFLIFFSYSMNFWVNGLFVLLLHDITDCFLILPRSYRDCRHINKLLLKFFYVLMVTSWIGCRIFIFSYCCVYASICAAIEAPSKFSQIFLDTMLVPGIFMVFMMAALEIMHIFWTYHILSSFLEIAFSPKVAKHTYD